eukprot:TRINITY_DN32941_c0_g1_i1.p1 TRINITY_DN32941_c0_g1~~TRINITY_DN32941_c0_g1_i1.p1  ORF type:complete len:240 (+),score=54.52 TRINITY_DN32941_c0_g1_i1:67-786(+)
MVDCGESTDHVTVASEDLGAGDDHSQQALIVGSITDHDFLPNKFNPWKCADCSNLFDAHANITEEAVTAAIGAMAAKDPEPNKIFEDGDWALWLGNMHASVSKRALDVWVGDRPTGGAVVVAAEGLEKFMPKWGKGFAQQCEEGGRIKAALQLKLFDTETETRLLDEQVKATAFISEARAAGRPVLVHCAQGKHRSAAVVCGYLMSAEGMKLDDAWAIIKERRTTAELTSAFRSSLLKL